MVQRDPVDWISDPDSDDDEECGRFFEDQSSWEPEEDEDD
jgi:hypothetical protein